MLHRATISLFQYCGYFDFEENGDTYTSFEQVLFLQCNTHERSGKSALYSISK